MDSNVYILSRPAHTTPACHRLLEYQYTFGLLMLRLEVVGIKNIFKALFLEKGIYKKKFTKGPGAVLTNLIIYK